VIKLRVFMLVVGVIGILAAYRLLTPPSTYTPRPGDPVQLVFAPNTDQPYVVTRSGDLLQPSETGWIHMAVDAPVNDVYIEFNNVLFAGTDDGLLRYRGGQWETVPGVPPTDDLESMHGFLFAMGKDGAARSGESSTEDDSWRVLKMPLPDVPAQGLVMLGDHTHIMNNGSLIQTNDMGLSWTIVPPPGEIRLMGTDALDNLLVEDGVYRWEYRDKTWSKIAPLPENLPVDRLALLNTEIYALADGRLFRLEKGNWNAIPVDGAGYLTTMAVHHLSQLWLADATHSRLWYTENPDSWMSMELNTP
jgi:hypothetical protein